MTKRRNDLIARLEQLSQKVDMSIVEIADLASKIVSVQIDPVQATGGPFVFKNRRLNCEESVLDPLWINDEVPAPDADVDLLDAMDEFKRDVVRAAELLEDKLTLDESWRINKNQRDWFRFWAARHPIPEVRERFSQCLAEREAAMEPIYNKADALARRYREGQ